MRNRLNDTLFESLLDDMSAEDLGNTGAAGAIAASSETESGRCRLYIHTTNNVMTVYHRDGRLWDIGEQVLDRTRAVNNCSVWCTPKTHHSDEGPEQDINIMDRDAVRAVNKSSSFFAQDLHLRFDFDERRTGDIAYMIKALTEAFMTFDRIIRLCNPDDMKARTEKLLIQTEPDTNPSHWEDGWLQANEYYRLAHVGTLVGEDEQQRLLKCLNRFASKEFTFDDLMMYFENVRRCSKKLFNEMVMHGADTRITQRVKFINDVGDNFIEIDIPKDVSTSLLKLNPELLVREQNAAGVRINVRGNLIIKDLEDFENVRFISTMVPHNRLTLRCIVTPKMIHYILTHFSFRTLDLSAATVWHDDRIIIDMSSPRIKNPTIEIIGNENIIVTER